MERGRIIAWLLVASATLVAQVLPRAFCRACDQPCCSVEATHPSNCCGQTAGRREGPTQAPCRCQLEPRDGAAVSASGSTGKTLDHEAWAVAPAMASSCVPQVLGASREYLLAALAVPIRPPRILFGVWRN